MREVAAPDVDAGRSRIVAATLEHGRHAGMVQPRRRSCRIASRVNHPAAPYVRSGVGLTATADEALMRTLYEQHAAALLGYVMRLVNRDRARAEDIVQETLLRAWRHPDALTEDRGDIRPWLFTVARRLVIDGVRASRSRPTEVPAPALEAVPNADDELDRALESWEIADA